MPTLLTETDKLLLLGALGSIESANRIIDLLNTAGTGNVSGPGTSTDNAVVRWDGTTGAVIQDSSASVDDSGVLSASGSILSGLTASTALVSNGSKSISSSVTTLAELAFVSGVTSAIQAQLNAKPTFGGNSLGANQTIGLNDNFSLSLETNGISRMSIAGSGESSFSSPVLLADGSAGTPSLSFSTDPDLGAYRKAANSMGFGANGVEVGYNDASGNWVMGSGTGSGFYLRGHGMQFNNAALAASNNNITSSLSDGFFTLSGDTGVGAGNPRLEVYGTTNLAHPNEVRVISGNAPIGLYPNEVLSFAVSGAGAVTIGSSGSVQTHVVNSAVEASAADTLTFTNAPTGTAGDPDVYLRLNINGVVYVVPAFQLP